MNIAFEGADGSGKSIAAKSAYEHLLEQDNLKNHVEIVSHDAFELNSSYLARVIGSRTRKIISYGEQNDSRVISMIGYVSSLFPYLLAKRSGKRKGIIISDRSPWVSGQIYVPKVSKRAAKVIMPILNIFTEKPDYIVYLQIDSDVALNRVSKKGYGQLYHSKEDLDEIIAGYDNFMESPQNNADARIFKIDTNNKTIDEVCMQANALINAEIKSKELKFIHDMASIDNELETISYTNAYQRTKDLFKTESLKKRLSQWYAQGKIDKFDGSEILDSLNKSTVKYALSNLAFVFTLSTLAPPGSFIIFAPARFLYTLGNKVYWTVKYDKEKAKVHGLDTAVFGAIPLFGRLNYLLPLYKENPRLYRLVKEHTLEYAKIELAKIKNKI